MTDYLESSNKIKCRRFQRRPLWCFLIECLLILSCVFSRCHGEDVTVAIYPLGDIMIEYGQPLDIFCLAENYSSSDIEFILHGNHVQSEVVNNTTRRLYIEKPEKQSNAYYCHNKKNGKKSVTRVLVESIPTDVGILSRLQLYFIQSGNTEQNETWTELDSLSSIKYSFSDTKLGTPTCYSIRDISTNTKRYCAWNTTNSIQLLETQYFLLTTCNIFGCNHQNFTIDHYSFVKPDPPYDLHVTEKQSHSVHLMWRIPDNMVYLLDCGIDHIIEYKMFKIDNTTQYHRVDASFLPPKNKTYRFQLSNLPYAYKQYEVRVFIKSKKAVKREFWSDFNYAVFYTDSERPKRPPDTITGSFYDVGYSDNTRVSYVHWKQLEEYEEAGTNFSYKVLVSEGNETQTVYSDKHESLSYVRLNATLNALDITVWSVNDKGSSLNSSHLYIPSVKDTSDDFTSFTTLAYENGTYELSWVAKNNIDNYTLFWCQHKNRIICAGRMDFAVLNANKSNHVIDLPREYRYQFAIAANIGSKTTGMRWADYEISKDYFPVHWTHDDPGKTFVTIRLIINFALHERIMTGYNITYCPIDPISGNCDKSFDTNYKFVSNPKQLQIKIENLIPFTKYQLSLTLKTIYGQNTIDNATYFMTTAEDAPTNPVNVSISDITNSSLVISWDPPIHKNGIIEKYVIYIYDQKLKYVYVYENDMFRRQVTVADLQSFTNYSLTVQACVVGDLCSELRSNDAVTVTTEMSFPSKLTAPTVNINTNKLHWKPPEIPGGKVDLYEISKIQDELLIITKTKDLSVDMVYCKGGVTSEIYEFRAVNIEVSQPQNNISIYRQLHGPWSEPTTVVCRYKRKV